MATLSATFTAVDSVSTVLALAPLESLNVVLTRTGSGAFAVVLQEQVKGSTFGPALVTYTADTAGTVYANAESVFRYFRIKCTAIVGGDSIAATLEDVSGESVGGIFPILNGVGTTVFDVSDDGIESPLVTTTTVTATNLGGTLSTAAQASVTSLGTLTALDVDNININGNTISSTAGTDLNITPLSGQQIVLDGVINVDAGVVTAVTDLTSDNVTVNTLLSAATATVTTALNVTGGAGAVAGSLTTATERVGFYRTTVTFAARALTVTDALAYVGTKVYDFPVGRIYLLSASASLQAAVKTEMASTINASAAMDYSFGTVTASNITLASTMVDIVPKVDIPLAGTIDTLSSAATGILGAPATFDGTGTAIDVYLNVAFPTDTEIDADGDLEITGSCTFIWANLGPV